MSERCTVIVTVDAPDAVLVDMVAHARVGIASFPEFEGYLAGHLRVSEDGTRLVQHLEWASHNAYERCRDDPRWDALPTTAVFLGHVAAGRASIDVRTYTLVAQSRASDAD